MPPPKAEACTSAWASCAPASCGSTRASRSRRRWSRCPRAGACGLPARARRAALQALDAAARGMPRDALIADLLDSADACVVLDHDNAPRGFAMLRRFGRGHAIGPVVAPDAEGAKALIAHLAGMNAGHFTRIDIDFASGLAEWLESIGLLRVDAPTTMVRGTPLATPPDGPRCSRSSRRPWAEFDGRDHLPLQVRPGARPPVGRGVPAPRARDRLPHLARHRRPGAGALPRGLGAAAAAGRALPESGGAVLFRRRCRPVRLRGAAAATCRWCAWWSPASCTAWSST